MPTATDTPTQFRSNFKCFCMVVRHGHKIYHPVTGLETGSVKRLAAEFGIHGGEYMVVDSDGRESGPYADIRGHFFDIDVASEKEGWTEDEKEAVRTALIRKASQWPEAVQIHSVARTKIPFPTYHDVPGDKVAQLVIDLGIAEQSLAYEQENENRPEVVNPLQEFLAAPADESEELTAV